MTRSALVKRLSHPYLPLVVVVLAILLTLPSLWSGLLMDDYHHKLVMDDSDSPLRLLDSPLDMFRFFPGDPERMKQLRDYGFVPWWTDEALKGAFWRPLSSITHWIDYKIWPDLPVLMHAHSILWYAALVIVVAFLYRRLMPWAWVAGLAAIFYALDDTHGIPVGFLANRNALLACFFGVLTLIAHDRWRRCHWHLGVIVGPLLLSLSLLSAEAGIATCAYLGAYMLFLERTPWSRRWKSMLPYVCVVLLWRIIWTALDYGAEHMGLYVDPVTQPWRYLLAVTERLPLLLLGQWAAPPADVVMFLPPRTQAWLRVGACLFLLCLGLGLIPLLRRDRVARFWALGMLLSVLPVCATFPSDRLLPFVGIGAMGLLAQFVHMVFGQCPGRPKTWAWRIPALCLGGFLLLDHLVIAPMALPLRAKNTMAPRQIMDLVTINKPFEDSIRDQDLVIVNPPTAFLLAESLLRGAALEQPLPKHTRILTSSLFQPVNIHRPDAHTLIVQPEYGYYVWVLDKLFRSDAHALHQGDRVVLSGMHAEILELSPSNTVTKVAFVFDRPLQDPSFQWLKWQDGRFTPLELPEIGQGMKLMPFSQPQGSLSWRDMLGLLEKAPQAK